MPSPFLTCRVKFDISKWFYCHPHDFVVGINIMALFQHKRKQGIPIRGLNFALRALTKAD